MREGGIGLGSMLIVSSNEKATALIVQLVKEAVADSAVSVVATSTEARRAIDANDYDAVLVNAPLSDEFGNELAEIVIEKTMASCIMIVKADYADNVSEKLEDAGVMVVPKPISKSFFYQAIKLVVATRKRLMGLKNENVKLQKTIDEIRLINRAKFALIQYLKFDEQQAHRYLEKQAMDSRRPKRDIALEIIKIYET
ncbi:MAG: ANTAR domain-containing protein [Oscillospiraceae bacterium]